MNGLSYGHPALKTEIMINGVMVPFDGCSSQSLNEARAFYGINWEYIGSSHCVYYNDVTNIFDKEHHFFIRKYH